ncbi:YkgJ family cysteine cluster protein [Candidatus Woesearchaeota archaeon]|nr:YkgJ family cysteine cluster protein [Candidatus Woesearchaeota archaeon]
MESKFACQHCGKCCSRISLDVTPSKKDSHTVSEFPSFAKNGYVLFCRKPALSLFDWEAKTLAELAEATGRKLSLVPYKVVYDLRTNTSIIIQYTFLEKDCPFHLDSRCQIYKDRPLICRSFPVVNGGLAAIYVSRFRIKVSGCPNDLDLEGWKDFSKRNASKLQFIKAQYERYGPSYLAKLESDKMLIDMEGILREMIDSGMIQVADSSFDPVLLLSMVEKSKQVPLTQFLVEKGNQGAESIQELISSMRELKWSTAIMEKWLA